ncbi:serine/threonine protein kinase, partial [Myxococcota bacterium]|nr:serine/threonine protein kinase [Myxococcota bacterium]
MEALGPGKTFARDFVLERPLGRGGHASVWLARWGDRRVALKVLHPQIRHLGNALERFEREGETLMKLEHPAIVRMLARATEAEHVYLVLEYVDGSTLATELGRRAGLGEHVDTTTALTWARDMAAALDYAHARAVVHRDVKPQNVLLGLDGRVRVADFGIARLLDDDVVDATTLGRRMGSVFYMAPEQVRGERAGPPADAFGLASVLFEVLTLRRTWALDSNGQSAVAYVGSIPAGPNSPPMVYDRMMQRRAPRPTAERPSLPSAVDDVFARALAPDPGDRYATPGGFVAALERALLESTPLELERTAAREPTGWGATMLAAP